MEFVATHDAIERLEAELGNVDDAVRLAAMLELAWHLRQRNAPRALALTLAHESATQAYPADLPQVAALHARRQLIRAEVRWLLADFSAAASLAGEALALFTAHADRHGSADAHWLLAWIAIDKGRLDEGESELALAAACAETARDRTRSMMARAVTARMACLRDPRAAEAQWSDQIDGFAASAHPGVQMWCHDFYAMVTHFKGSFGPSAHHDMIAFDAAVQTGQLRAAITCASNIAESFGRLNDYQVSLDWAQRGLDLARQTAWPRTMGASLMHLAEIMRQLGNFDAADALLVESLATLAPLSGSRPYAIALQYRGDLALDRQDYVTALDAFEQLELKAAELNQHDFRIDSKRGQAHALSFLGEPMRALQAARTALSIAHVQLDVSREVDTLMVLADIATRHPQVNPGPSARFAPDFAQSPTLRGVAGEAHAPYPLASVADVADGGQIDPDVLSATTASPLHYLERAMQACRRIEQVTLPGKLLTALSRAYADSGDYRNAHATAMLAIAARDKTHGQEIINRSVAMQVVRHTEQAQADAHHHRQLAQAEAKRAQVLQQTTDTLQRLSAVGQDVTKHLDAEDIFRTLDGHLHDLLDVASFAIYLLEPSGTRLVMSFCIEAGQRLPLDHVDINDPHANSARCVREGCELLCDLTQASEDGRMPGTLQNKSGLYGPLSVGQRVLGALTIQSQQPNAYGDRERLIFRTLCAYAAIALDNAQSLQRLKDTQTQLLEQQKLAALGAMVAGVAHELNTPLGNSLLIASTLHEKSVALTAQVAQNQLRRSDMLRYLQTSEEATELIMRSVQTAADLVASFKQVSVDRTTEHRREFQLRDFLNQVVATLMNRIHNAGHSIRVTVPTDLRMNSYPGPLGQVLTNLIMNAIVHGYAGRRGGTLTLQAQATAAGRLQLTFADDGDGIAAEHLGRIFDPFFTTKMGQGGSGLGLSISFNIVTSVLGGQLLVESTPGCGTAFTLQLPQDAPS